MATLKYTCQECDSEFSIKYRPEDCEDSPRYCAFCGSYVLDDDTTLDDE